MPMNSGKSKLLAKYGTRLQAAAAKHAADPIDWGNVDLPGGIVNGVAKLDKIEFGEVAAGKTNAGQMYFQATGIVVEPEYVEVNGSQVKVAGGQTRLFEMVCDTKTTKGVATSLEDHVAEIQNHMKKLAGDEGFDVSDLEAAGEALTAANPYFRFSTQASRPTQEYPEPRVWHRWHGSKDMENYLPPDATAGAVEEAAPMPQTSSNGSSKKPPVNRIAGAAQPPKQPAPSGKSSSSSKMQKIEPQENHSNDNADGALDDEVVDAVVEAGQEAELLELVKLSEGKGKAAAEAQEQLNSLAAEAGVTQSDIDDAKSWAEVAELVRAVRHAATVGDAGTEDESDGNGDAPAEWVPQVEQVYKYVVIDRKTNKPVIDPKTKKARPAVEVEVKDVDEAEHTVTLLNIDDGKTLYKDVNWDLLTEA